MRDVARGIGLDNRIGTKFLQVGPGFGGSCFPKDALALIKTAQEYDSPLRIVETMVAVNDVRKRAMARKVAAAFGGSVRGKLILFSVSPLSPIRTTCAKLRIPVMADRHSI